MNPDKIIDRVDIYEQGSKHWIDVYTVDGWTYRFYALREGEPYQFDKKFNPDSDLGRANILPQSVADWFANHPEHELVNENTPTSNDFEFEIIEEDKKSFWICPACDKVNGVVITKCPQCNTVNTHITKQRSL